MAHWLIKTEPSAYSFADLVKEKRTAWTGVSNPVALKNMRMMQVGDEALFYHTGDEKAVVGTCKIVRAAYLDPAEKNDKLVVVDVAAGEALKQPVTLGQIKADTQFKDWALVKIGRLSVVSTTPEQFAAVLTMGGRIHH